MSGDAKYDPEISQKQKLEVVKWFGYCTNLQDKMPLAAAVCAGYGLISITDIDPDRQVRHPGLKKKTVQLGEFVE